jgi:hypothetical protein
MTAGSGMFQSGDTFVSQVCPGTPLSRALYCCQLLNSCTQSEATYNAHSCRLLAATSENAHPASMTMGITVKTFVAASEPVEL